MRIHTRLAWIAFAVTVIALGGATLLWNNSLQRERRADLDQRLLDQARLLNSFLPVPGSPDAKEEMDHLVRVMNRETGVRYTVIARNGEVLAESGLPADEVGEMENHLSRPEVQQALEHGLGRDERVSPTLEVPYAYLAVRWGSVHEPFGVARVALPMDHVVAEQHRGRGRLALVVLGAIALAALLDYVSAKRVTRPVARMSETARQIAAGHLDRRVEPEGSSEVRDLGMAVNHLADSVEVQINRVEAERQRLARLLQGMPDGILALDETGRIVLANPAARTMLSLEGEVAGLSPVETVRSPELQQAVDAVRASGKVETREIKLPGPGAPVLSVSLVPLETGMVVVIHDVTRLRRLEHARREIVANIGHELRTPLTAILGYLETLDQSPDLPEAERDRFLAVISRNARRLERLVKDLSRLSRLESSQVKLDLEPVRLDEVTASAVETVAPRAREKDVEVVTEIDSALPVVQADRHGLETVLLNLLDNALRVSPRGASVKVRVRRREGVLRVEVEDRGPGIPQELRDRVFERFYRIDPGRASDEGGSGLGLAIVKHTVILHGGEVGVEGGRDGGAVFHFTIPAPDAGARA